MVRVPLPDQEATERSAASSQSLGCVLPMWEQHSVVRRGTRGQPTTGLAAPGKPDLCCSVTSRTVPPLVALFHLPVVAHQGGDKLTKNGTRAGVAAWDEKQPPGVASGGAGFEFDGV